MNTNALDIRTIFPPSPIGYLILMSGRESQAVAACKQAYEGLRKRAKAQIEHVCLSFLQRPGDEYVVLVEVHCQRHGIKTSFAAGGAVPFKLGTSLAKTCLSAESVRLNMQDSLRRESWSDKILRWLST